MKTGVIFMTALVPTIGHKRAIHFASKFMKQVGGELTVVISSRSFEPSITMDRISYLAREDYGFKDITFVSHMDDNAPQNCETDEEWGYWLRIAGDKDYLFGSDSYCKEFAARMGAQWIPIDPYREVVPVQGRTVRENLYEEQDKLLPSWVKGHSVNVVLFGQESVGKTTMSKMLGNYFWTNPLHEWARPYLEMVGPELTKEKMANIASGQIAAETSKSVSLVNILDTDILSTYGYYKLLNQKAPEDKWVQEQSVENIKDYIKTYDKNRLYVLMSDEGVPFEQDQLRYGDNERETDMKFWEDILQDFGFKYIVATGSFLERFDKIVDYIEHKYGFYDIINFKREEP